MCWSLQDAADRVFEEPFREGSPRLLHMDCHAAWPACCWREGWSREAQVHRCQDGGLYLHIRFSHPRHQEPKKSLFKSTALWKSGLSIYPILKSQTYHSLAATCSTGVKLETVTRGWRVYFFSKPTFTLSLISHAHPAPGPAAGLPMPWLGSPLPRGLPRLPGGQGRAGQGWMGLGWGGGPGAARGRRCPSLRGRGPGFPSSDKSSPRSQGGWFGATPSWHVVTGFHTHRAWERREVPAMSAAPPWLAAAALAATRWSRPAAPEARPHAGHRRSKWDSVQSPPGRDGQGQYRAGQGSTGQSPVPPTSRSAPRGVWNGGARVAERRWRGRSGRGRRGAAAGGGRAPGAVGGPRARLPRLSRRAPAGPGAPHVRCPLPLLCLES